MRNTAKIFRSRGMGETEIHTNWGPNKEGVPEGTPSSPVLLLLRIVLHVDREAWTFVIGIGTPCESQVAGECEAARQHTGYVEVF